MLFQPRHRPIYQGALPQQPYFGETDMAWLDIMDRFVCATDHGEICILIERARAVGDPLSSTVNQDGATLLYVPLAWIIRALFGEMKRRIAMMIDANQQDIPIRCIQLPEAAKSHQMDLRAHDRRPGMLHAVQQQ